MVQANKTNLPAILLALSFLIIASSIAYYFIIFLPGMAKSEMSRTVFNKNEQSNCLEEVRQRFQNISDGRPFENMNYEQAQKSFTTLLDEVQRQRENCIKQFPSE